jgi:hypothetical protein
MLKGITGYDLKTNTINNTRNSLTIDLSKALKYIRKTLLIEGRVESDLILSLTSK